VGVLKAFWLGVPKAREIKKVTTSRDDKGRGNGSIESSCRTEDFFITLGGPSSPLVISTEAQRSGEISVLTPLPGNVFRQSVPGFPATQHWTRPRMRLSLKERRMMFDNASNFYRKSGVA
jgi:hypothetical protein